MPLILKVMNAPDRHALSPEQVDHVIYSDVSSVSFQIGGNLSCTAYVVFASHAATEPASPIHVAQGCSVYVMNENGKTISTYVAPEHLTDEPEPETGNGLYRNVAQNATNYEGIARAYGFPHQTDLGANANTIKS